MAKSQYEYVKHFEQDDSLLKHCWIVVRLDGKGFTKYVDTGWFWDDVGEYGLHTYQLYLGRFTKDHGFEKPHDARALELMNAAAQETMLEFGGGGTDICVAFGESDEYSFVFHRDTRLYQRRASKLVSLVTSCFTGWYVRLWSSFFPTKPLERVPMFDGRAVLYPTTASLRDYLSWRQADTHINCQYNTCYWLLMGEGRTREECQDMLKGTLTRDKNEIMFQRGVNYNDLPEMFRKGSVWIWVYTEEEKQSNKKGKKELKLFHEDIIKDGFWNRYPHVLK